jgi:hypothetical protein
MFEIGTPVTKLSDTKIRAARPRVRPYKLFDTDGLFLLITPTGRRWWRQRYRFAGKERLRGLGTYPEIGLAEAREESLAIRKLLAKGLDPALQRKEEVAEERRAQLNTLKAVALEWHTVFQRQWSAAHASRVLQRLDDNVFPWIGDIPIRDVTGEDVLVCLDRMTNRGAIDTARRVLQILKKIFNWAIGRRLVAHSPIAHVEPRDHLPSVSVKHRAAVRDPQVLGTLLSFAGKAFEISLPLPRKLPIVGRRGSRSIRRGKINRQPCAATNGAPAESSSATRNDGSRPEADIVRSELLTESELRARREIRIPCVHGVPNTAPRGTRRPPGRAIVHFKMPACTPWRSRCSIR